MELFQERGYAQTTVADIAARAGLTERTFFRYFSDKREVLFSGSKELEKTIVDTIANASPGTPPLEVVAGGVGAAAVRLQALRDISHVRLRYALVTQHPELRERELIKMVTIAEALTEGLRRRGVPARDASLAAEAGIVVFRVAWVQWLADPANPDLGALMAATLDRLTTVTATH